MLAFSLTALLGLVTAASAAETVQLMLKDHHFTPDHIQVPADQRFRVELTNQDDTTDELESTDMKFEKIVVPGGKIGVFAGPLHPGTYKFYDEYHQDTATGQITAAAGQ
jgi:hypothetical protein